MLLYVRFDATSPHQETLTPAQFQTVVQHKATIFHIVVRNGQTFGIYYFITKQHDVEIQRAWSPAFRFTDATLLQFDTLCVIE